MARVIAPVDVRRYEDRDEDAVLSLLEASLGGGPAGSRPAEFFRWKHLEGPFGRSYLLVAEADGRIVGLRAFMRWRFEAAGVTWRAVRAVDTATHPDYQGRGYLLPPHPAGARGPALRVRADLQHAEREEPPGLPEDGMVGRGADAHLRADPAARSVRPPLAGRQACRRRPCCSPRGRRHPCGGGVGGSRLDALLRDAERAPGICTERSDAYLRWRYGDAPLLDYRAVSEPGRALAIFRVRPRGALVEATVSELIVRPGDVAAARRALARVARSAAVDHLTCSFPSGTTGMSAGRRAGYIRIPGGMTLVANPLGHALEPDPLLRSSWAPSLGDLEVF